MTPLFPVDVGCGEESVVLVEFTDVVSVAVGTPLVVVPVSDALGMSELMVVYAVIVVVSP
jgi:hypothetical protein